MDYNSNKLIIITTKVIWTLTIKHTSHCTVGACVEVQGVVMRERIPSIASPLKHFLNIL